MRPSCVLSPRMPCKGSAAEWWARGRERETRKGQETQTDVGCASSNTLAASGLPRVPPSPHWIEARPITNMAGSPQPPPMSSRFLAPIPSNRAAKPSTQSHLDRAARGWIPQQEQVRIIEDKRCDVTAQQILATISSECFTLLSVGNVAGPHRRVAFGVGSSNPVRGGGDGPSQRPIAPQCGFCAAVSCKCPPIARGAGVKRRHLIGPPSGSGSGSGSIQGIRLSLT